MKAYSIKWKKTKQKEENGWAQKHDTVWTLTGSVWKWHYIKNGTEYVMGLYRTRKEARSMNGLQR